MMTHPIIRAAVAAAFLAWAAAAAGQTATLLNEGFEHSPLGPAVDEDYAPPSAPVFTHTPPPSWSMDNSGMPSGGVEEWRGWSFARKDFWIDVADNQDRDDFTRGSGVLAIADPDEFDDKGSPLALNRFNSIVSVDIHVDGIADVTVEFDSDYRQEEPQEGDFIVEFDDGSGEQVLLHYGPDNTDDNDPATRNLHLSYPLTVPAGATTLTLKWALTEAANDWWWAIDNVLVAGTADPAGDYDGDGVATQDEGPLGTDWTDPDSDNDGLDDGEESTYGTSPTNPDSDGDGVNDGTEVLWGYDPMAPEETPVLPAADGRGLLLLCAILAAALASAARTARKAAASR